VGFYQVRLSRRLQPRLFRINPMVSQFNSIARQGSDVVRQFLADPRRSIRDFYHSALFRWLSAGLVFLFINSIFMVVEVEYFKLKALWATLISAELCTVLRFFVNEHWVFKGVGPVWKRLLQYHLANAGSFVAWMIVANLLIHWGIHYLLASALAVAVSIMASMASNFLWVWRKLDPAASASSLSQPEPVEPAAASLT
jgi:putative flippase GtrA